MKWNKLASTDPKDAWCLASVEMAKEFFDNKMTVVPRLEEAPFFDIMVCFTKPGNKTAKRNDYQLRGHLIDIIDRKKQGTNLSKTLQACQNTITADIEGESRSHEWKSPCGNKVIKIKLDGLSKEVINWASLKEIDLIFGLDKIFTLDRSGRKGIYIISEVVYASNTSIMVKIGDTKKSERVSVKIPVAFSYTQFPIDMHGKLKQVGRFSIENV